LFLLFAGLIRKQPGLSQLRYTQANRLLPDEWEKIESALPDLLQMQTPEDSQSEPSNRVLRLPYACDKQTVCAAAHLQVRCSNRRIQPEGQACLAAATRCRSRCSP
jgi:hypothetical protein